MRSRLWPFAQVALVVFSLVIIPACGSNDKNTPPAVIAVLPAPTANGDMGVYTNIIVKFDRTMDASTVTSLSNYALVKNPNTNKAFSVQHLPELNEVRIIPSQQLDVNSDYTVVVSGLVASSTGVQMGVNIGFTFDTINTTLISGPPAFSSAPTAVTGAGAAGTIDLSWAAQPTEPLAAGGSQLVSNVDVYISTVSGGEDLMLPPAYTITLPTGDTIGGLVTGTQYFIKLQPRDAAGNVMQALTELTATAK